MSAPATLTHADKQTRYNYNIQKIIKYLGSEGRFEMVVVLTILTYIWLMAKIDIEIEIM